MASLAIAVGIGIAAGMVGGWFNGMPLNEGVGGIFKGFGVLAGAAQGAFTGAVSGAITSVVYGQNVGKGLGSGAISGLIGYGVSTVTEAAVDRIKPNTGNDGPSLKEMMNSDLAEADLDVYIEQTEPELTLETCNLGSSCKDMFDVPAGEGVFEVITSVDLDEALLEWYIRNAEDGDYHILDLYKGGGGDTTRFYINYYKQMEVDPDFVELFIYDGPYQKQLYTSEELNYVAVGAGMKTLGFSRERARRIIKTWNNLPGKSGLKDGEMRFGMYGYDNIDRVVSDYKSK